MRSSTKAVDQPLVFSGGGAAAQILASKAAGGSSPCLISTSITGVVDPAPSRRERLAVVTSSISRTSFSFPRFAARSVSWSLLSPVGCVAANGRPVGTDASAPGSAGRSSSWYLEGGTDKKSVIYVKLSPYPQIDSPYGPCEPASRGGGAAATVTTALWGVYFAGCCRRKAKENQDGCSDPLGLSMTTTVIPSSFVDTSLVRVSHKRGKEKVTERDEEAKLKRPKGSLDHTPLIDALLAGPDHPAGLLNSIAMCPRKRI
nr:uncharacterized protein LOC109173786 [Ipomoea batatas]